MIKLSKELRAAFTRELIKAGLVVKVKKMTLMNVNSYCLGLLSGGSWAYGLKNSQRIVVAVPPAESKEGITSVLNGASDINIGDWVIVAYIQVEDYSFNFAIKNKGI